MGLAGYADLSLAAAEGYLDSVPDTSIPLYPGALADAIELLLGAHEITGDDRYLARAKEFGAMAEDIFFADSPLPKASSKHDHYEAITRGDTLALVLLKLWAVEHKPELVQRLVWNDR